MAVRERAVYQIDKPIVYSDRVLSTLPFFLNRCLSGPYLGKYKRDWN